MLLGYSLSEDASSTALEQYMPHIRQAVYKLLIRLKAKQEPYRIAIAEKLGGNQTLSMLRAIWVVSLVPLSLTSFSPLPLPGFHPTFALFRVPCTLPACCVFHARFLFHANKKAFVSPLVPISLCVALGGMDTNEIFNFHASLPFARPEARDCHL